MNAFRSSPLRDLALALALHFHEGEVSLALAGTGSGWSLGVSGAKFTITRKKK